MAMIPHWPDEAKTAFINQQFHAQHTYYQEHFSAAQWLIIQYDGQPAGRLYVNRSPDAIHIIDITLLPEFRGLGLGGHILRDLLAEAAGAGQAVLFRARGAPEPGAAPLPTRAFTS